MEENMKKIEVGQIFMVLDEDDQEQEMEVLGLLTVDGMDYTAVGFVEDILENTEDEIDVFFFRIEADGELLMIDNDEEFEKVSSAFSEAAAAEEEE